MKEDMHEGHGWSALLKTVAEELREERERLESQVNWRVLAEAEREIAPELATEARRRLRERVAQRKKEAEAVAPVEEEYHQRFSLLFRVQHIALFVGCIVLIVTGLPLRYAEMHWAEAFFARMGGVPVTSALHRVAAAVLIAVGVFHMGYIILLAEGRREFRALLPGKKDFGDLFHNLLHFVGLMPRGPRFDRFSYVEKFDYWAVYWGMVIMIGSGILLWFPEIGMRYFPKYALDIAQVVHSDEALLAATAIVVWHFYNVHFNPECFPIDWAWLTGRISKKRMRKHHPLEYERHFGPAAEGGAGEEVSS
ncbi:MAG: cytochrome b/b6 domain-containing protein [Armatimonadetes bacterium]|nr:cytochrome b/b6 domain-containing protein [Armatimonadota bacterium]NIM23437.1 cytochrome b/b6 domain-containing protein [Armatimonadota bacterium]NIM67302.1 cytochrome b/b6 domain-containing protein [Armatimonadota bacterium]NIM75800.1 cytochrome b/b6 domain-containing protein [Armatimonadota bacterium]NIN05488.1 cytochrome b/b6 domain-containing protein [Armatimonadota bacterium]